MQENFKKIAKVATVDVPVLITGETGTGKELIAREIHMRGARAFDRLEKGPCAGWVEYTPHLHRSGAPFRAGAAALAGCSPASARCLIPSTRPDGFRSALDPRWRGD